MNSYGKYKRPGIGNGYSQTNKKLYDVCDNVESLSGQMARLQRAIKLLCTDVKDISEMLQEYGCIRRTDSRRQRSLSYGSDNKRSKVLLQGSVARDAKTRFSEDKGQCGSGLVDIHEQRQRTDAGTTGHTIAFDVEPPNNSGRSDMESEPE